MNVRNCIQHNKHIHFIGIGGIGMSGLAQFFKWMGYTVSGSDRALDMPENEDLFEKLKKQGIKLYPQDGSFIENQDPGVLVYSTAIEDDNLDLLAGKNISQWHRADALSFLINILKSIHISETTVCPPGLNKSRNFQKMDRSQYNLKGKTSIAVAGSCGKTTVSAWLGETLLNLGEDPIVLVGGLVNRFADDNILKSIHILGITVCPPRLKKRKMDRPQYNIGNFRQGNGKYLVYEADESDKSLVAFNPDYLIILNIGTDHYPEDELVELFEETLRKTRIGAVIESKAFALLDPESYKHLRIQTFSTDPKVKNNNTWSLKKYSLENGIAKISCKKHAGEMIDLSLPIPGIHNAENALSIIALIDLLGINSNFSKTKKAIEKFGGVHRRFELVGKTINGTQVYDDYSHNVEKIMSAISTFQEISEGRVIVVFQPHGFGAFGFMKEKLFSTLEEILREDDKFIFMPVYYAGGTTSFVPTSNNVCKEYARKSAIKDRYLVFDSRIEASKYLNAEVQKNDVVAIMGARDESLSAWAKNIVASQQSSVGIPACEPVAQQQSSVGIPACEPVAPQQSSVGIPACEPVAPQQSSVGIPACEPVAQQQSSVGIPACEPVAPQQSSVGIPACEQSSVPHNIQPGKNIFLSDSSFGSGALVEPITPYQKVFREVHSQNKNSASDFYNAGYYDYEDFAPFNPYDRIDVTQRNLPHWQQSGKTYFITFRLADSLPKEKLDSWLRERGNWLDNHQFPLSKEEQIEYSERFPERLNNWLDRGAGSCILKDNKISEIVVNALKHFDGERYKLGEWVVMPNHVHILITPDNEHNIADIMHSLKSYTAQMINKRLSKSGTLWQRESYDHIVRSLKQKHKFEQYIQDNPIKANLKTGYKFSFSCNK